MDKVDKLFNGIELAMKAPTLAWNRSASLLCKITRTFAS